MSSVLFSVEPPLAFLTFNRPEAHNALTWEMYQGLLDACEAVDANPEIRVLVLRGAGGKAFAAGTDIAQFAGFRTGHDGGEDETRIDATLDPLQRAAFTTNAPRPGVRA